MASVSSVGVVQIKDSDPGIHPEPWTQRRRWPSACKKAHNMPCLIQDTQQARSPTPETDKARGLARCLGRLMNILPTCKSAEAYRRLLPGQPASSLSRPVGTDQQPSGLHGFKGHSSKLAGNPLDQQPGYPEFPATHKVHANPPVTLFKAAADILNRVGPNFQRPGFCSSLRKSERDELPRPDVGVDMLLKAWANERRADGCRPIGIPLCIETPRWGDQPGPFPTPRISFPPRPPTISIAFQIRLFVHAPESQPASACFNLM